MPLHALADLSNLSAGALLSKGDTAGLAKKDLTNVTAATFVGKTSTLAYGSAARSLDDRFGDTIDVMETGCFFNGTDDDIPGMHAARDIVLSRGRGRIVMPPRTGRFNSALNLLPLHGASYCLEGHTRDVTTINISHDAASAIRHGDTSKFSTARTPAATFRDFSLVNNYGTFTLGNAAFDLYSCDKTRLTDIRLQGFRRQFNIGSPVNADDAFRTYIDNIFATDDGSTSSGDCGIAVNSAVTLQLGDGCFFNGSASSKPWLLQQSAAMLPGGTTLRNIDGLVIGEGVKVSQWKRAVDIQGAGLSNAKLHGWSDRASDIAINLAPAAGGTVRGIEIIGWKFEGHNTTTAVIDADTAQAIVCGGAGTVYEVDVTACHFLGFGGTTIDFGTATACKAIANSFRDCAANASLTPSIINVGSGGQAIVGMNSHKRVLATACYRPVAWGGSSDPTHRLEANNAWGTTTNASSGTP